MMRTGHGFSSAAVDFLAKQHMTADNLPTLEAAQLIVCPLSFLAEKRLAAMYAAQVEAPSVGLKWKLRTAALFLSRFSLVSIDLGVFGLHRVDL